VNKHLATLSSNTVLAAVLILLTCPAAAAAADSGMDFVDGQSVYRFYCYQCHGYAGNAQTLSSTYLDPKPRDFTRESRESLPVGRMLEAVREGRAGTAMINFDAVLTPAEIEAVVWYIRDELLGNPDADAKYHSPENGWVNHDRYRAAFPFVTGELSLGTPPQELDATQQAGRELYVSACVSCHDQPNSAEGEAIWETRAVSFPRDHYSHRQPPLDAVSGASPYARHEIPTVPEIMTDEEARGMQLYQDNCAFCHAPDGTGQNWIGSFLEPKPRDFTSRDFALGKAPDAFRERVRQGIPNTAMPAWRHVLSDEEIDAIIAYVRVAFRP
jgi:cytochrome c oxidase cbb3-type subunit 3